MNEETKRTGSKKKVIAIIGIAVAAIAIIVVFFIMDRESRLEEIYGRLRIAFENSDHEAIDTYSHELHRAYGGRRSARRESAWQMQRTSTERRYDELTELHNEAQRLFSQGEYSQVLDLLDFIVWFVHDVEVDPWGFASHYSFGIYDRLVMTVSGARDITQNLLAIREAAEASIAGSQDDVAAVNDAQDEIDGTSLDEMSQPPELDDLDDVANIFPITNVESWVDTSRNRFHTELTINNNSGVEDIDVRVFVYVFDSDNVQIGRHTNTARFNSVVDTIRLTDFSMFNVDNASWGMIAVSARGVVDSERTSDRWRFDIPPS